MKIDISGYSLRELVQKIEEGSFLSNEEIKLVVQANMLNDADTAAMEEAFRKLQEEGFEVDGESFEDEVMDGMGNYAYSEGLGFDSDEGFWEASNC